MPYSLQEPGHVPVHRGRVQAVLRGHALHTARIDTSLVGEISNRRRAFTRRCAEVYPVTILTAKTLFS